MHTEEEWEALRRRNPKMLMTQAEWFDCRDPFHLWQRVGWHDRTCTDERYREMAHHWVDRVRDQVPYAENYLQEHFWAYDHWRRGEGPPIRELFPLAGRSFDQWQGDEYDLIPPNRPFFQHGGRTVNQMITALVWGDWGDCLLAAQLASRLLHQRYGQQMIDDEFVSHFHDVTGNPFQPVNFEPSWRTSTALSLARGIYDDNAFDRMPILADALQDAGCENESILRHCRCEKQVHLRGCWVVDFVLGRR